MSDHNSEVLLQQVEILEAQAVACRAAGNQSGAESSDQVACILRKLAGDGCDQCGRRMDCPPCGSSGIRLCTKCGGTSPSPTRPAARAEHAEAQLTGKVWLYMPSKGWGYTFRVPCIVVGKGYACVKIAAITEAGKLKTRFIAEKDLTDPRTDYEAAICTTVRNHWNERTAQHAGN